MKLTNTLDKFNTHSIHYIILAARTTQDLRNFTDTAPGAAGKSLQAIEEAQRKFPQYYD